MVVFLRPYLPYHGDRSGALGDSLKTYTVMLLCLAKYFNAVLQEPLSPFLTVNSLYSLYFAFTA